MDRGQERAALYERFKKSDQRWKHFSELLIFAHHCIHNMEKTLKFEKQICKRKEKKSRKKTTLTMKLNG